LALKLLPHQVLQQPLLYNKNKSEIKPMGKIITLEGAVGLAMQLSPLDKIHLIERLAPCIEKDLMTPATRRRS
jgi:hypothetical protein